MIFVDITCDPRTDIQFDNSPFPIHQNITGLEKKSLR